ncbi:MAG: PHP domain-containing protein, partial [Planctomycetota bacterium]
MKVELHLHTSRYSACALDSPEQMLAAASDKGYDAVFLTEHDTVWPKDRLDGLARNFPDLLILPGLERTIRDQHLLILGTSDEAWLSMTRLGPIFARARKADCLTILA